MGSDTTLANAWPIAWRIALALTFAVLAVQLLFATQYYATIFFLAVLALALMFGVARLMLKDEAADGSVDRAITQLQAETRRAVQVQEHRQALLDTVSAALLMVTQDGRVMPANRAAWLLLRSEGPYLANISALGTEAATIIAQLMPGRPTLVRLASGRDMFASAGYFSSEGNSQRLISLQAVAGELDALQLKAWEDMSRVLAHEIMNSLTPIASLSESLASLIRQDGAKSEIVEAIDTVARRSHGLAGFVARYRQIAELPDANLKAVSLQMLTDDVHALMHERLARVCFVCRVEAATVIADPDLLSQAVINLLHNAVDAAMDCEDPTVELVCMLEDHHVVISVADNGKGIPVQFREDIFVPFFTTKAAGSGIGLSVVRQIALKHGGHISVDSNTSGGATFRLMLPQASGS
jgi:nitrogen fixation/metabolism regulation signal transduction histidine kinase